MRPQAWLCGLVIAASLLGCVSQHASLVRPTAGIELTEVPFVPQMTDQCGPAALSMVLSYSGVRTNADDLRRQVHVPDHRGSLQLELVAASRQYGRIAYTLESQPNDLFALLEEGWPVIVLQNLGARWLPIWHYAVVIGYELSTDQIVLRSGATKRKLMRRDEFSKRWSASDYWALVVIAPSDIPGSVRATEFLQAVSANESLGQRHIAQAAYEVATHRWPNNLYGHLGLGNVYLGFGELDKAIEAYHAVLALDSNHFPTLNNLAYAYADRRDQVHALATIERALAVSLANDQMVDDLLKLKRELVPSVDSSLVED